MCTDRFEEETYPQAIYARISRIRLEQFYTYSSSKPRPIKSIKSLALPLQKSLYEYVVSEYLGLRAECFNENVRCILPSPRTVAALSRQAIMSLGPDGASLNPENAENFEDVCKLASESCCLY